MIAVLGVREARGKGLGIERPLLHSGRIWSAHVDFAGALA